MVAPFFAIGIPCDIKSFSWRIQFNCVEIEIMYVCVKVETQVGQHASVILNPASGQLW